MQRKITRFAFAGKCGGFGASGDEPFAPRSPAEDVVDSPANATYPNPEETPFKIARRDGARGEPVMVGNSSNVKDGRGSMVDERSGADGRNRELF